MLLVPTSLRWVRGYSKRDAGEVPGTFTATYRISQLVNDGYLPADAGRGLLMDAGLVDLVFQLTWAEDFATPDEMLIERIDNVQGYVVFIHGWTGNHTIWESVPGLVVAQNRQLVALSVDHNGFGAARFVDETPSLESCNPPTAMRTLERLIDVLKLRRQPGQPHFKVINFVGHSMGGAMLFYLDPLEWAAGEETRLALAPALLLEDDVSRIFFTTLGIGIGIVNRIRLFEVIERTIKPQIVETICAGGSSTLKRIHTLQYQATPRGITAATLTAMGVLNDREIPRRWNHFRIMLGHRDALVGLVPMMDLLSRLEFPASNLRVVAGSHYFFSVGPDAVFQHAQNRELVVEDILTLHESAYNLQKKGLRVG